MKKILLLASAIALVTSPALAQTAGTAYADGIATYNLSASVSTFCKFGATGNSANTPTGTVTSVDAANGDATYALNIQNANDNTVTAASAAFNFSAAQCNTPFQVLATSTNGGLLNSASTSDAAFTSKVGYQYAVNFDGLTSGNVAPTAGASVTIIDSTEARAGSARFFVTVPQSSKLLLAGAYTDSILITLSPRT